jgi:hypothetical protein
MAAASTDTSPYAAWTMCVHHPSRVVRPSPDCRALDRGIALLAIPSIYIYVSRALAARKLKKTGIGKGAPGFLTSVKRVAVPPEIAARIRRGEEVSPEEISAAIAAASQRASISATSPPPTVEDVPSLRTDSDTNDSNNEWLPDHLKNGTKRKTKSKRK